jgi:GrpB-like predicted nucleotidyltransferase (UPF0157 family)
MFKGADTDVNLHVFSTGTPKIGRILAFRDQLRTNESDRKLYASTRRVLAHKDWKYTQNYAGAKPAVIEEVLSRAQNSVGSND